MRISLSHGQVSRAGNMILLMAIGLIGLLGVVAISMDGGAMLSERRQAQAVADAAALAAAADLFDNYWTNKGQDPSQSAAGSAVTVAADNGYANDGVTSTVTVHIPPQEGPFANKDGYVEVVVAYQYDRAFSAVFSGGPVTIRARAVAMGKPVPLDVGMLVLDKNSRATLNVATTGTATMKGMPIVVNSTHQEAITMTSGTLAAESLWLNGGYSTSLLGVLSGSIVAKQAAMEDPLRDLVPPNPNNMTVQQGSKLEAIVGDHYLKPGVYFGGINMGGMANLYLEPGVYFMEDGGFAFSGLGTLKGEGVMIYTCPSNSSTPEGINVSGAGSITLSGPTSGPYQGITFWQRRDANVEAAVTGNGNSTQITGTFYLAGALLKINGTSGVSSIGSQYISQKLELGGTGDIVVDWQADKVARKRSIHLVE